MTKPVEVDFFHVAAYKLYHRDGNKRPTNLEISEELSRMLNHAYDKRETNKQFIEAFRAAYPNIRQLQEGWATFPEEWSTWDEEVRQQTIALYNLLAEEK